MILITLLYMAALGSPLQEPPSTTQNAPSVAGVVNGDTIWLDSYAREVGRRAELNAMGGSLSSADVMESTWKGFLKRKLLRQESARRNITITQQSVDSVLLKATPDFVRRGIVDPSGHFDPTLLAAMLYRPDSLARARMHGASKPSIDKNVAAINSTMSELRERVADLMREDTLRALVYATTSVDTNVLKRKYDEWRYRATADVAYLPCEPLRTVPTDTEISAWYAKDPSRYISTTPVRQLGVFTWPLTAAPFDSNVVLQNVRAFVAMINGEHDSVRRDSIWNSVASTVSSMQTELHPDSVGSKDFYEFVRSTRDGKPGTCIGPIMHPAGVHILLVDSVFATTSTSGKVKKTDLPTYAVRVILAPIEPSQPTADSILTEVRQAVDMFRAGSTAADVAKAFHKKFTITRWVSPGDKLFGSYRLVQAAFETPVGSITDPIDTPDNGIMLAVVVDSMPPGTLPVEAARDRIVEDINRDYACTRVTRKAQSLRAVTTRLGDGRMFVAESIPGATIWRDLTVDGSGFVGPEVYDPTASLAIRRSEPATLMGPFLGDAGWWVANVNSTEKLQSPSYHEWLSTDGQLHKEQLLSDAWNAWLSTLEASATIVDLRWIYFRF